MTFPLKSKFAAISAVQLICTALTSGQTRVNPQAEAMAHFSERVTAYLALQKKVEGKLSSQKETNDPERIKAHIANLAEGIRLARADAKAGDVFNGAAEQFRQIIREDAKDRSVRDAFAAMQEVPSRTPPRVNAAYPETAALATVPPLILKRLQQLPEGVEYRFMGRDLILRDTKANLIVDLLAGAVPTVGR
jgi:hypothetical protein